MVVRLLLALLLVSGCGGLSAPEPEGPLSGEPLVEALRDGGYVLYLRHTATVEGAPDGVPTDPCAKQRGLTEAGRAEARALGSAIAKLDLPIGNVVASPFCRTVETAELAFGEAERDDRLLPDDEGVRDLLSDEPSSGNRVLVGHIANLRPVAGATPEEGGTVVFRPHGDGFSIVAEVGPGGWQRLATRYG